MPLLYPVSVVQSLPRHSVVLCPLGPSLPILTPRQKPRSHFPRRPQSNDLLDAGTSREFVIVRQDHRGDIILSLKRIQLSVAWQRLRQIAESDAAVTGVVAATNRGGLLVDVEGVRGFNPSSQIGIVRVWKREGWGAFGSREPCVCRQGACLWKACVVFSTWVTQGNDMHGQSTDC